MLKNTKIPSTQSGEVTMSGMQQKTTRYRKVWKCKERDQSTEANPETTQTAKLTETGSVHCRGRPLALSDWQSALNMCWGQAWGGTWGRWQTSHRRQSQQKTDEQQLNTWRENYTRVLYPAKCSKNKGKTKILSDIQKLKEFITSKPDCKKC